MADFLTPQSYLRSGGRSVVHRITTENTGAVFINFMTRQADRYAIWANTTAAFTQLRFSGLGFDDFVSPVAFMQLNAGTPAFMNFEDLGVLITEAVAWNAVGVSTLLVIEVLHPEISRPSEELITPEESILPFRRPELEPEPRKRCYRPTVGYYSQGPGRTGERLPINPNIPGD